MKLTTKLYLCILAIAFTAMAAVGSIGMSEAFAKVTTGQEAPAVSFTDTNGVEHSLEKFKGKTVVLEWNNQECPFVKKFYKNGDMQAFQTKAMEKGVVWVSINSSAAGKQGHLETAEKANKMIAEKGIKSAAYVLDHDGSLGKAFGAKTTPHMFVIDAEGKIAYQGAIDSNASADSDDIAGAQNYVMAAIDNLMAGKAVETAETQPYGCSVKY